MTAPPPPGRSSTDTLTTVARLVWPGAAISTGHRGRGGVSSRTRELVVTPTTADPRLLLPSRLSHARAAVAAFGGGRRDLRRRATELALVAASARVAPTGRVRAEGHGGDPREPDLLEHIATRLDRPPAWLAVRLGTDRPNRKPVVAVGDEDGRTVAFAKLGWAPLSDHLVAHEARTLAPDGATAGLRTVRAPALLLGDDWHGHRLVVAEALGAATGRAAPPSAELLTAAIRDIGGELRQTTVGDWVEECVRPRVAAVPDAQAEPITRALQRTVTRLGDLPVEVGSWHGDFRPWNMAPDGTGRLEIWDWERHGHDRLLGTDAVHLRFPVPPRDASARSGWRRDVEVAAARSVRLLARLGHDRDGVAAVRIAHTVELLLREHEDVATQADVARPHQREALLQLLDELVAAT